jgi:hypothetical protein
LFEGFVIPALAVPSGPLCPYQAPLPGYCSFSIGLMWPMLKLETTAAAIAFWFLVYSAPATIVRFAIAARMGAGASIIPISAQGARGSDFQETLVQFVIYRAAIGQKFCAVRRSSGWSRTANPPVDSRLTVVRSYQFGEMHRCLVRSALGN